MDWFLYDNGLRHERVKCHVIPFKSQLVLNMDEEKFNFPSIFIQYIANLPIPSYAQCSFKCLIHKQI